MQQQACLKVLAARAQRHTLTPALTLAALRPRLGHKVLQLRDDASHQRRQQQAGQRDLRAVAGRQNCQVRPADVTLFCIPHQMPGNPPSLG